MVSESVVGILSGRVEAQTCIYINHGYESFTCEMDAIEALLTMAGAGSGPKSSSSSVVSAHRRSLMVSNLATRSR
jgi:hypothetical protein